jgi:fermentation-respiration switch protein FrsA (DUF1100 family)
MGGVVSQLCVLLVKNQCRPSVVANALTFAPPDPPYYELRSPAGSAAGSAAGSDALEWALDPLVAGSEFPGVKIWILKTALGSYIPAFFFAHPQATLTVLFSHGNAADCGAMRERYIQLVRKLRVNVLAYDYTGYGASSGEPSEAHTYADICAAYDHLVARGICQDPAKQIVLYGQSVGSGPSVKLASEPKKRPVRGLILHAPILSGIRVLVANRGPLACCDIYPNISRIPNVRTPVLIIHGEQDEDVGVHHGRQLQLKVPAEHRRDPLWVRGAGHNDIVENFPEQYYPAVGRFLRSLEADNDAEESAVTEVTLHAERRPLQPAPSRSEGQQQQQQQQQAASESQIVLG